MKKLLLIIIISCFVSACSQNSKATTAAPEGMNQEFYEESVDVLTLINNKMNSNDKMSKKEEDKIDSYFQNKLEMKMNSIESKVYGHLSIIYPTYMTYIQSNEVKEKEKILKQYNSDLKELSNLLNIN